MPAPSGFTYRKRGDTRVVICHHGRHATTLRGETARDFLARVKDASDAETQELMARLTGNYRRGNERTARNHPRNR